MVERVSRIGRQLPLVVLGLQQRQRGRPPYAIDDQCDLHDLLQVLLRIGRDDVRPEKWSPSSGLPLGAVALKAPTVSEPVGA